MALLEGARLMEIYYGHPSREKLVGNIYRGRIEDVVPGMGSAFVDVGEKKSLFLPLNELNDGMLVEKGFKPWQAGIPIGKILRQGQMITLQVRRDGIGTQEPAGDDEDLDSRAVLGLPSDRGSAGGVTAGRVRPRAAPDTPLGARTEEA